MVRPRTLLLAASVAMPAVLGACSLTTECRVTGVYGLRVQVEDSISGQAAGDSAVVTAADSAAGYLDTLFVPPNGRTLEGKVWLYTGVPDRPGIYKVVVRKPGYVDWVATNVELAAGACGVQPFDVVARLVAAP